MSTPTHRFARDPEGLNAACWPVPATHLVTPTEQFFTRSHAPTPILDPTSWRLEIGGLVDCPRSYSLAQLLGELPRREVAATLVCAGLRRDEFLSLGELPGELPWGRSRRAPAAGPASLWVTCSGRWASLPARGKSSWSAWIR